MKKDFAKHGHREKIDKLEKRSARPGAIKKDKVTKRRLSIYDDFAEEDLDEIDPKVMKHLKHKR